MSEPRTNSAPPPDPGHVSPRAPSGPQPDAPEVSLRERLETGAGWLRERGLSVEIAERFLFWWKHFGIKQGLAVFTIFILPALNAEWTAKLGEHLIESVAENYGVEAKVGSWSGAWLGTHATAHDVVISVRGPFDKKEILKAANVSIDLSIFSRLTKGYWIKSIEIDRPSVYLERTLSGRWNWEDVIEPLTAGPRAPAPADGLTPAIVPASTTIPSAPSASSAAPATPRIQHLEITEMKIESVEHLPAASGNGLIRSATATLFVDDVHVTADHIGMPDSPMSFSFDGRTADGRVSIAGRAGNSGNNTGLTSAIYLENVGAAAVGRLTPDSQLVPASGIVNGRVELEVRGVEVDCRADVTLKDVTYAPNPYATLLRSGNRLREKLATFVINGPANAPCTGRTDDKNYRVLRAVQVGVTQQAVQKAPAEIRAAAAADVRQPTITSAVTDALRQKGVAAIGRVLGTPTATALQHSTSPTPAGQKDDPLTRGVKSVGSGIKHLFGGGKRKKRSAPRGEEGRRQEEVM